ncbi:MAG: ketopantoate reductase family protein [Planctomycetota bacterium]|jgi:2-dehydropantoate 2-reductase
MDAETEKKKTEEEPALDDGPKVVIVGAGTMGLLWGLRLQEAGHDVSLVVRSAAQARLLMEKGVTIVEGNEETQHEARVFLPDFPFGSIDYLLVAVKSYATAEALEPFLPRMRADTTVISLQNGLGHIDPLLDAAGSNRLVIGTTSVGANRPDENTVVHAGDGPTLVGALSESAEGRVSGVVKLLGASGFDVKAAKNIKIHLWEKLLVNAVINPLTAINDVPNRMVAEDAELRDLVGLLLEEGIKMARLEGVDLDYGKIEKRVFDVARRTGDNISSMLQDVRAGRRTEIEEINGVIVRIARKRQAKCEANEKVLAAVLDKTRQKITEDAGQ